MGKECSEGRNEKGSEEDEFSIAVYHYDMCQKAAGGYIPYNMPNVSSKFLNTPISVLQCSVTGKGSSI